MKLKFAKAFASVLYIGKLPLAPGTCGSLVALFMWLLIISHISSVTLILLTIIIFIFGVYTSSIVENESGISDPSMVVVDEWVGQWIALLFLPYSLAWGIVAFGLFRIFDIWKPFPIRKLDNIQGGWGIMLDDVLAGIYSLIIVQLLRVCLL